MARAFASTVSLIQDLVGFNGKRLLSASTNRPRLFAANTHH
jgi:hypothetical protein